MNNDYTTNNNISSNNHDNSINNSNIWLLVQSWLQAVADSVPSHRSGSTRFETVHLPYIPYSWGKREIEKER